MCGILGLWGSEQAGSELMFGLTALQHRGQDAAGVLTFDGGFRVQKGNGLVSQVFQERHLERLRGSCGVGHVRYATMGEVDPDDAQPIYLNYPYGLAMAHNGNLINFVEVRDRLYRENHRLVDTSNDIALILYTFAAELEKRNLETLSVDEIFECVEQTQRLVRGAYAAVGVIADRGLIAFADPHGIRPAVLGLRKGPNGPEYAVASETTCLDYLGYEPIGELGAGEAIFIDTEGTVHRHQGVRGREAFCVFEYIYFMREDSTIRGRVAANERVNMGRSLVEVVRQAGVSPDVVVDVPASGYFFASALAEELGVPYRRGLAKNNHVGRSFILPETRKREQAVRQKLNPIPGILEGKKVAVVDDSIVRGTTSRRLVQLLRAAGAREVYVVSAAPPITHPCVYGIDMSTSDEIIAANHSIEEIRGMIGADALIYQDLDVLRSLYEDVPCCYACFSGEYPTGLPDALLADIARDKARSCR